MFSHLVVPARGKWRHEVGTVWEGPFVECGNQRICKKVSIRCVYIRSSHVTPKKVPKGKKKGVISE